MAIVKKFEEVPTTAVSDALKGLNNLDQTIKPVKDDLTVAGRATTVKLRAADNKLVLKAIAEANPEDVLVIDAKGYMQNASCGDFVIGLAETLGLKGVVIDGAVRDIQGIRDMNYPVFCKGTTTAASDKHGTGEVNGVISCGDTAINPGDIIVGDADGVVVVPQEDEETILEKSLEKLEKDEEREEKILGNPEEARKFIMDQLSK
ncbi:RraA family protein [Texcoconibacillus texcoconensis]|uniref:Putative 4-hydroxy-4-methyl-2-oxoglutarate aldolase n=1 Tax=Texcoconibacillus texcoconensis TaxID=1095777 RepID=A0A840QQV6_9BACI|nr:RraA family protein [Texcoconibacillus texcoconensis]MBB5173754.1 regulator of RNase E activity RraA [Texcoconibacillus texcoconensis]